MGRKMTVKQAVEEFFNGTVSESLIYKECREGNLPHVRMTSGKIILDETSLEQWWSNKLMKSVQPMQRSMPDGYGKLRRVAE